MSNEKIDVLKIANMDDYTSWLKCPGCDGKVCFDSNSALHMEPPCDYFIQTDVMDIIVTVRESCGLPDPNSEENAPLSKEELVDRIRNRLKS
jgi:hypothetical protein